MLTEHKAKCTKEGKYVEAKLTDDRLQETKAHLKEVRQRILERKHEDEVYKSEEISNFLTTERGNGDNRKEVGRKGKCAGCRSRKLY